MKITNRIVENYVNCRYKAHLALKGEAGTPHDYEVLMNELRDEFRPKATQALLKRLKLESLPTISLVTIDDLKKGHPLILNCTLEHEQFRFHFDALKRVNGRSSLGRFQYVPVVFHHEDKIREEHKLPLAFGAYLIGQLQAHTPETGVFVCGQPCRVTTVRCGTCSKKLLGLLDNLGHICAGSAEARIRLNKHCDICEWR